MKRISILLLTVIITSLMPVCVSTAYSETYTDENDYTYELDYGMRTATVINFPSGESTYTVPAIADERIVDNSTHTFYVVSIAPSNLSNLENAEHITLPYTLLHLVNLSGLPKLKSVDFSQCSDFRYLDTSTFEDCTALEAIDLSVCKYPSTIYENTFKGCTSLTSVKLPDSIKLIKENAFAECDSLAEITLPDGVTEIGEQAFYGCESLKSITLPAGVSEIKSGTFKGCTSLEEIVLMCNTYADVKTIAGDAGSNAKIVYKLVKPTDVTLGTDGIVTWNHTDVPKEFHLQLNTAATGIWGEVLTPLGDEVTVLGSNPLWKYDFSEQIREHGEDRYCVTISAVAISAIYEESDEQWSNIQTYAKPYFDVALIDDIEFAIERYKDYITATYLNITDATLYYTIVPEGQYSLDNPPEIDTTGEGIPLEGLGYMAWDTLVLDGFTADEAADVFMVAVNDVGIQGDMVYLPAPEYVAPHFAEHSMATDGSEITYSFAVEASYRMKGAVMAGIYSGTTLKGLAVNQMPQPGFTYTVTDIPIEVESGTTHYKMLLWDGTDTMTELCGNVTGCVQSNVIVAPIE